MSEHRATIRWARGDLPFTYDAYPRAHDLSLGDTSLRVSAAADFRGDADLPNPEDMLVGALSSCHMLTFLAVCARKGLVVERYEDEAIGYLERDGQRGMSVKRVVLRPRVTFADPPSAEALAQLHAKSHEDCFIARSVKTEVSVESR